jgi:hypothetical protein
MSSSRSLASARTKRASGNSNSTIPGNTTEPIPQPQTNMTTQKTPPVKMSLPQAIHRIGERLNNLELFAETTTKVVDDIQDFHNNTSDKYIVDSEVFTSIVSRIEALEANTTNTTNTTNTVMSTPSNISNTITNDIDDLKNHLIRLQTYVMQTNAKLQDIVFSTNGSSLVTFDDVFSDSHPTPPTLIKSANNTLSISPPNMESNEDGSMGSVELELDEKVDNSDEQEEENVVDN